MKPAIHVVEANPFAPQPHAFTDAAVCLRDAIRAAGHASEHLVNQVPGQDLCIVVGASLALPQQVPGLDPRRCAIFNLEPLGNASLLGGPDYRQWLADWLVADDHAANIALLRRENGPRQQAFLLPLVPCAATPAGPAEDTRRTDVLLLGRLDERRRAVMRQLQAMGLRVEVQADSHGADLAPAIQRARLVLHVHAQGAPALFRACLFLQAVTLGVPVVCESALVSAGNDWTGSGMVFADYAELGEACARLLADPAQLQAAAARTRAFAAAIDFATPFAALAGALEQRAARPAAPAPATGPAGEPLLTIEEIEAILAREAALPPEPDQRPAEVQIVRREPGQGPLGAWAAWLLIAFILLGAINAFWPH